MMGPGGLQAPAPSGQREPFMQAIQRAIMQLQQGLGAAQEGKQQIAPRPVAHALPRALGVAVAAHMRTPPTPPAQNADAWYARHPYFANTHPAAARSAGLGAYFGAHAHRAKRLPYTSNRFMG